MRSALVGTLLLLLICIPIDEPPSPGSGKAWKLPTRITSVYRYYEPPEYWTEVEDEFDVTLPRYGDARAAYFCSRPTIMGAALFICLGSGLVVLVDDEMRVLHVSAGMQ